MRARNLISASCAALVLSAATLPAHAGSYSAMYTFGDSLSDTGNIANFFGGQLPLPPYAPGRFSNGDVWVEGVAAGLSLEAVASRDGGTNYAFGGALTGGNPSDLPPLDLGQQRDLYLGDVAGVADSSGLYVVWGGGNDVRDEEISNSVSNLEGVIRDLAAAGAVDFLVPNLPDIGLTPESLENGTAEVKSALSLQFNMDLRGMVSGLNADTSIDVNIKVFNVYSLFALLVADPTAFFAEYGYSFSNVDEACYAGPTGLGGPGDVCANPEEYVFWDGIHPTASAHALLAAAALDRVAVPLPAALPLLLAALGFLGFTRRRTR